MYLVIYSYLADLIFGDPEWLWHPVRLIGRLILFFERMLCTKYFKQAGIYKRITGVILSLSVITLTFACGYLFIILSKKIHPFLGILAAIYLGYTCLAAKDLLVKAKNIYACLKENNILIARKELAKIVGRDTDKLDEKQIIKAAVESIAENTCDGIIAPLFYLFLGGPLLALVYKAISTLDSMVGYKNEKYIYFGWFSARLDDAANFIPARLGALLIPLSSFILNKGFKQSFKTMLRDHKNHPSPNSGFSESAMAGSLGIRLGGPSVYQNNYVIKPFLGEEKTEITAEFINDAVNISLVASFLMLLTGIIVKCVIRF